MTDYAKLIERVNAVLDEALNHAGMVECEFGGMDSGPYEKECAEIEAVRDEVIAVLSSRSNPTASPPVE